MFFSLSIDITRNSEKLREWNAAWKYSTRFSKTLEQFLIAMSFYGFFSPLVLFRSFLMPILVNYFFSFSSSSKLQYKFKESENVLVCVCVWLRLTIRNKFSFVFRSNFDIDFLYFFARFAIFHRKFTTGLVQVWCHRHLFFKKSQHFVLKVKFYLSWIKIVSFSLTFSPNPPQSFLLYLYVLQEQKKKRK